MCDELHFFADGFDSESPYSSVKENRELELVFGLYDGRTILEKICGLDESSPLLLRFCGQEKTLTDCPQFLVWRIFPLSSSARILGGS